MNNDSDKKIEKALDALEGARNEWKEILDEAKRTGKDLHIVEKYAGEIKSLNKRIEKVKKRFRVKDEKEESK